jgi:hypothetical protein
MTWGCKANYGIKYPTGLQVMNKSYIILYSNRILTGVFNTVLRGTDHQNHSQLEVYDWVYHTE